jgi:ABC-2 type transport system ATP-binding protein
MPPAIEIRGVSKRFSIGKESFDSLKDRVVHFRRTESHDFWALKDINLEVQQGETYGLLGHNGSGKSTLLKCIADVMQPTTGEIITRGRMSALLELGAGFHPDLTGRENVELNGLLLGLGRKNIAARFDDIIAFAGEEVERAIDRQVKFYSSGMYVRLAFAIAVNVEPEILLVDEVLAVGDEAFQHKCMNRVRRLQAQGCTIVFVTHGADVVRMICDRAAVLDHGDLIIDAKPALAVRTFREHLFDTGSQDAAPPDANGDGTRNAEAEKGRDPQLGRRTFGVKIRHVDVRHPNQESRQYLLSGEPLDITVTLEAAEPVADVILGLAIMDKEGRTIWTTNTDLADLRVAEFQGETTIAWHFEGVPLLDGDYDLKIGVTGEGHGTIYDWIDAMPGFDVMSRSRSLGLVELPVRIEGEHVELKAARQPS